VGILISVGEVESIDRGLAVAKEIGA
jgi:hypothetical protein